MESFEAWPIFCFYSLRTQIEHRTFPVFDIGNIIVCDIPVIPHLLNDILALVIIIGCKKELSVPVDASDSGHHRKILVQMRKIPVVIGHFQTCDLKKQRGQVVDADGIDAA